MSTLIASPARPTGSQRMRGQLDLRFTAVREQTRLFVAAQQPPLQVVRAFPLPAGATLVHLHNIAGGVLGGDHLTTTIALGPQAQAQLTTTGATRIYRSRDHTPATQITSAQVAEGGLLEYLPDATIPFAGAVYDQTTRIELGPDAGLCWWEILAPGREAYGERFAYEQLRVTFDLWALGRPLALERVFVEPARSSPASSARFGPYAYLATCYICRVGADVARWQTLERDLAQQAATLSQVGRTIWGVSTLPAHGLIVRGLSTTSRDLPLHLPQFWATAKRELYGRAPNVPRKMY
jgi:urease accessory protein